MASLSPPKLRLINEIATRLGEKKGFILKTLAASETPISSKLLLVGHEPLRDPDGKKEVTEAERQLRNEQLSRKYAEQLRDDLEAYSLTPAGRTQPYRLRLPKEKAGSGGYQLIFEDSDAPLKSFWWPYFSNREVLFDQQHPSERAPQLSIVYAEPLFYRFRAERSGQSDALKREQTFLRDQDLNFTSANSVPYSLHEVFAWAPKDAQIARNYVASGDASAALTLTRWFERLGITTETKLASQWGSGQPTRRNSILIGNARTFPVMAEYLAKADANFQIDEHQIINRNWKRTESREASLGPGPYEDDVTLEVRPGARPITTRSVKGVVSRFKKGDTWITLMASNHSRFFQAAAEALTDSKSFRDLFDWCNWGDDSEPFQFELFGQARVTEHEEADGTEEIEWRAKRLTKERAVVNPKTKGQRTITSARKRTRHI